MCGIVGIYQLREQRESALAILQDMTSALLHRGPDDVGFYSQPGLGLGFRRLSFIDLEGGNQPLFNEDHTLVSVCNGEIYNFLELREWLEGRGHHFVTRSDTEILVHMYEEKGLDFVKELNGQFAFAIYDKPRRRLVLARDQAGITPLFYTRVGDELLFASEIKALLRHPAVNREVDLAGLDQVFSYPGLVSPRTMFKNIHSLPPGHLLESEGGEIHLRAYWDLIYPEIGQEPYQKDEYYLEKMDELFQKSVSYRLLADVPIGFYLSGGLDSSLIGSLIHELKPGERRHSFSIAFPEREIDERRYQRLMAEHLGSQHHEIPFDWPEISGLFRDMIFHAEMPVKESYNTCSMALSHAVRANGIKAVLTGEGADELFAGYIGYRMDTQRERYDMEDDPVALAMAEAENEALWGDPHFFYEIRQYEMRELKSMLYSNALRKHQAQFDSATHSPVNIERLRNRHPIHRRSYLDFKLRLSDHLLQDHGDRVAYANSMETRYPFLDLNLMEFATKVPPHLKLNGMVEKYIIKKIAEKRLPHEILNREKFGFVAPGSPYLLRQNLDWIRDILSKERIKRQGYFDPESVARLVERYSQANFRLNLPFESDLLMIVLSFGLFLDVFQMPDLGPS